MKFHSKGIVVHFNFSPEAAVWAMKYLTTKLNEVKVPFAFEVLHNGIVMEKKVGYAAANPPYKLLD